MQELLRECVRNFGEPPRVASLLDRLGYLHVGRPYWLLLNRSDRLTVHFQHLSRLFAEGRVVWGHIIQANRLMFQEGNSNCPGEFVYSVQDSEGGDPVHLARLAHDLFRLKGTKPSDPELKPIAEYLTDELVRSFGLAVPTALSPDMPCLISSTMLVRKHLPRGRLCSSLMPLVVSRQEPRIVTVLPERYWPRELIDWWVR